MADENELSLNERRFVAEYVDHRNATQAYIRAFSTSDYTPTYLTANKEGSLLVRKPRIAQEIEAAAKEYGRRCGINARKVLREYALVAFADKEELYTADPHTGLPKPKRWDQIRPSMKRLIQSIKVKKRIVRSNEDYVEEIEEVEFKLADKMKALDGLCKHLGLTKESDAVQKLLEQLATLAGNQPGDAAPGTAGSTGTTGE